MSVQHAADAPDWVDGDQLMRQTEGWEDTLQHLLKIIDLQGPFNGVMGFSQVRPPPPPPIPALPPLISHTTFSPEVSARLLQDDATRWGRSCRIFSSPGHFKSTPLCGRDAPLQ